MPNTIQLRENLSLDKDRDDPERSRRVKGWWHGRLVIHNRNSDGNLYVRYLYWNDRRWNSDFNWLENDWNGNNPAAVLATGFTSLLV